MGMLKQFLYFLTDADGKSYHVNNGVVEKTSAPMQLPVSPDNWLQSGIKFSRNPKWYALFRSFTTPLKFVADAAQIVRTQLYNYGTEEKIYLLIARLDKSFGGGWIHRLFYKGELDLTQADDEETYIGANIMEGDLVKLFNANSGTTYEVPLNVPDAVLVKDDGVFLYETVNYLIPEQATLGSQDTTPGRGRLLNVAFINQEGAAFGIGTSSVYSTNDSGTTATDFSKSVDWLFTAYQDVATLNFSGTLKVMQGDSAFEFYLYTSTGRKISLVTQTTAKGVECTLSFSVDFSVSKGENVFFVFTGFPFDIVYPFIFIRESTVKLSFKSRYKTTYTRCLRPAYVAQVLLDKITGGGYTFHSDYLSNVWDNLVITSGDGIRGFDTAVIKTSFEDFFTSYNVPCNLCLFIKDRTLYIEPKAMAYGRTIVADLGEITKFIIKPSTELQFNVVKIGYPNIDVHDFDSLNAKGEFNNTNTFTSLVSRVNKVLDLTSKYKASMYEQELTRINLDGKTTTSDSSDNSVFFKHIERTLSTEPGSTNTTGTWYYIKNSGGTILRYFLNTYSGFYDTTTQPPPFPPIVDLSSFTLVAVGFFAFNAYATGAYPTWDGNIYSTTNTTNTAGVPVPPYYNLLRESYTSATGLLDPATAFNIGISPKRCLFAHGNYLRMVFYWLEHTNLTFQTSDISAALVTVQAGLTIAEDADENIGSFDEPLAIPLDFIVESPMSDGIIDIMNSDPAETFQFNYNGVTFYGNTKDISIQPGTKAAQTTTLQCSTMTDLTKLILR
jgi:hypothetical protein